MNSLRIILLSLFVLSNTLKIEDNVPEERPKKNYLIFDDEFDGFMIDPTKWTHFIGPFAKELEFYTDRLSNSYVADGYLHLRAMREDFLGYRYTSARLNTSDKFSFLYGTVETRLSIPAIQGIFPAFWLIGDSISEVGWPKCGEIDIMEAINQEFKVYMTLHWGDLLGEERKYGTTSTIYDIREFHTYRMEWTPFYITIYIDDIKFFEMSIVGEEFEAFHQPMFLLCNVAVGGAWPGYIIDDESLPQEMLIDYVRVYQDF